MAETTTVGAILRAAEEALTRVLVEHGGARRQISEQTIAEVRAARNAISDMEIEG